VGREASNGNGDLLRSALQSTALALLLYRRGGVRASRMKTARVSLEGGTAKTTGPARQRNKRLPRAVWWRWWEMWRTARTVALGTQRVPFRYFLSRFRRAFSVTRVVGTVAMCGGRDVGPTCHWPLPVEDDAGLCEVGQGNVDSPIDSCVCC
jgi:hypothetical protein